MKIADIRFYLFMPGKRNLQVVRVESDNAYYQRLAAAGKATQGGPRCLSEQAAGARQRPLLAPDHVALSRDLTLDAPHSCSPPGEGARATTPLRPRGDVQGSPVALHARLQIRAGSGELENMPIDGGDERPPLDVIVMQIWGDWINGGPEPETSGLQNLRSIGALDALLQSPLSGKTEPVDL